MTVSAKLAEDRSKVVIEMTTAEAHTLAIWFLNLGFLKPNLAPHDLRQALREVILRERL